MAWDFETEPEFEAKLEWIRQFVAENIEPLDLIYPGTGFHPLDDETGPLVRPKQEGSAPRGCGPRTSGRSWAARVSVS